jgi:membrane-bound ClpP family serine protease
MFFKRNLHTIDRVVRLLVGMGCVYLGFIDLNIIGNTLASTLVGIFGIINLFAALFSYCPVYGLTGISTYRSEERNND